ncbi:MAG: Holliday junction resolvase RuvX [Magnetovibrio sp.]|nr:Holliday junction resolvase RuvX [Magnetovibrio sp.]|tara:strand:- start:123 stop:581 length:459 start_codon:yes stop_codon:yes gene_type:complete
MAVIELAKMAKIRKPTSRLMGLDLGSKTIGLALSDVSLLIASPLGTIKRSKFSEDADTLEELVDKHDVGGLVIGLPINMNGTEGPRCQSTRQFAKNFLERLDIPLAFWDERLSTKAVERVLIDEIDMTRKRRAGIIDKAAATFILQGALDYL